MCLAETERESGPELSAESARVSVCAHLACTRERARLDGRVCACARAQARVCARACASAFKFGCLVMIQSTWMLALMLRAGDEYDVTVAVNFGVVDATRAFARALHIFFKQREAC